MLARLRGMPRMRGGLLVVAALLAGATTASASWHLPGAGVGVAHGEHRLPRPERDRRDHRAARRDGRGRRGRSPAASSSSTRTSSTPASPASHGCGRTSRASRRGATVGVALAVRLRLHGRRRRPTAGRARRRPPTRASPRARRRYGVWSQDNAGNLGAPAAHSAIVDSTKPTVTRRRGRDGGAGHRRLGARRRARYTVYANATDAGSPAERHRDRDRQRLGHHARADGARRSRRARLVMHGRRRHVRLQERAARRRARRSPTAARASR